MLHGIGGMGAAHGVRGHSPLNVTTSVIPRAPGRSPHRCDCSDWRKHTTAEKEGESLVALEGEGGESLVILEGEG